MRFIEGIGYIDETTTYQPTKTTEQATSTTFDTVLATEAARLEETEPATTERSLDDIFREASETYGVSYDLLKAIAYNESGFRADATSYVGAMGIMQLMPSTASSLGVTDAYDPYQNIMGGAKLLSQLSNMYNGDLKMMIAAYNAGPGNVAKYGGVPPFKETQNYVAKVLDTLNAGTPSTGNIQVASAYQASGYNNASALASLASQNTRYTKEELDSIFSFDEYSRLLTYFDYMMKVISEL